jgi:hypothetical protein
MHSETICDLSLIFVIHEILTAVECESLVALSEAKGYEDAPITTTGGFVMRKDLRDNLRVIVDGHGLAGQLFDRAQPYLPKY